MLKILLLLMFVFLMDIKQSMAEGNFSKCYERRCYLWNGKISNYNSLEPCPHGYWTLEIYDEEVQKEVDGFVSWLLEVGTLRSSIRDYYVPLNISCENKTSCTWKHKNQKATYLKWTKTDWTARSNVYLFQASNQPRSWGRIENGNHNFGKICMRDTTTENIIEENDEKSGGSDKEIGIMEYFTSNLYLMLLLAIVSLFSVVIGIILCIVFRRKKRSRNDEVADHSGKNAEASVKDNEQSVYAQINRASEVNPYQNDSQLQYADISFCSNISQLNQNGSKSSEVQKSNYLGPMGDVYAAVQKP